MEIVENDSNEQVKAEENVSNVLDMKKVISNKFDYLYEKCYLFILMQAFNDKNDDTLTATAKQKRKSQGKKTYSKKKIKAANANT